MLAVHPDLIKVTNYTQNHATGLMRAAWGGNVETVQKLLAAKAEVDAQDRHGNTALMQAVLAATLRKSIKGFNCLVVDCLLKANADISLANREGKNVLQQMAEDHPLKPQVLAYCEKQKKQVVQNNQEVAQSADSSHDIPTSYCSIQ